MWDGEYDLDLGGKKNELTCILFIYVSNTLHMLNYLLIHNIWSAIIVYILQKGKKIRISKIK